MSISQRFDRIGAAIESGTIQQWTVPVSGPYRITAAGAEGGHRSTPSFVHGRGARIAGTLELQEGDTLLILCGHKGRAGASDGGSGGGGGTFVAKLDATGDFFTGGFYAGEKAIPLVVAGGGMGEPNAAPGVSSVHGRATTRGVNHQSIGHGTSSRGSGGGGDHSYASGGHGGGGSYNAGTDQLNLEGSISGGNAGDGWVEIALLAEPITINGTVVTSQGDPAGAVFAFDWQTGAFMGKAEPTASGAWELTFYPTGDHYGLTYTAAGFQPITHGPYPVE